ncbi:nucleotidyl transferase AbiEii/AbiGii toxin family protein [Novosphingobium sp. PhB57]|jgi:hypothetical protein|uniref:nucleotidyl transferase AbiEii/AbiGii toxin family protein n=1 Tax=Novosphingobium sp. PhB57 TaxID=2485107 RepID=UPI001FB2BC17|nr:nucleotidyl transferase AbiEii/AbiGii toxin family protein [Novosphingobium sp. PhB57]
MNPAYAQFLAADPADRRDVFIGAGQRLGTAPQNIEKDFWVCWTLDALFNGPASHGPRFLFKGGTSLSKGFGLIQRFSEDIDITVFREDIGQDASVEALEEMSGKKRQAKLDDQGGMPGLHRRRPDCPAIGDASQCSRRGHGGREGRTRSGR